MGENNQTNIALILFNVYVVNICKVKAVHILFFISHILQILECPHGDTNCTFRGWNVKDYTHLITLNMILFCSLTYVLRRRSHTMWCTMLWILKGWDPIYGFRILHMFLKSKSVNYLEHISPDMIYFNINQSLQSRMSSKSGNML